MPTSRRIPRMRATLKDVGVGLDPALARCRIPRMRATLKGAEGQPPVASRACGLPRVRATLKGTFPHARALHHRGRRLSCRCAAPAHHRARWRALNPTLLRGGDISQGPYGVAHCSPWLRLALQRLQIGDHVSDLRRIKPELRHRRVPGHNAFRTRLVLDRIPQLSERWRDTEWTCLNPTDGVALSTVCLKQNATSLRLRVLPIPVTKAGLTSQRARSSLLRATSPSLSGWELPTAVSH